MGEWSRTVFGKCTDTRARHLRVLSLVIIGQDESRQVGYGDCTLKVHATFVAEHSHIVLAEHSHIVLRQVLCGDEEMTKLNKKWMGKEYPTDVLSFPMDGDEGLLGDIVICLGTAKRQVCAKFILRKD